MSRSVEMIIEIHSLVALGSLLLICFANCFVVVVINVNNFHASHIIKTPILKDRMMSHFIRYGHVLAFKQVVRTPP